MTAIEKRIQQVDEWTKRDFANHEVKILHSDGVYRCYLCQNPDSSFHHFYVTTIPGSIIVTGDVGDMIWSRNYDMMSWVESSIDSIDYFASKVVCGDFREEFCWEVARDWVEGERATLKGELIDANEVEDQDEIDFITTKLDILSDLEEELFQGNQEDFIRTVYEEYSDYDCEVLDSFWNYSYEFLNIRMAIKWLLDKLEK